MGNRLLLNELKLNSLSSSNVKDGDIIIVFKGNIYPINRYNESKENINYIVNVIKTLCHTFTGLKSTFFDKNENIKEFLLKDRNGNFSTSRLFDSLYNFSEVPKLLFFEINDIDGELALSSESFNGSYDIINSKELKQLVMSEYGRQFKHIFVDGKLYKISDIINNGIPNQNIPIADRLYHGTCIKYANGIINKGIRSISNNSIYNIHNDGYVFLTTSKSMAMEYALSYSRKTNTLPCVFEIDSTRIDKNRITLDYDFVNNFSSDIENSPYNSTKMSSSFKGGIARNTDNNGTKFSKIGYHGIIMPSAITGVYVYNSRGINEKFYTKEQFMNEFAMKENKIRINEWKPSFYNELPEKIKLYHGTDMMALNDIIEEGVISAKHGRKRSETYGVNWFSTKLTSNFGHGSYFSIEVPKCDFDNHKFNFMNEGEVTSEIREIPIYEYNFRIETIGNFNEEDFRRVWGIVVDKKGGDIFDYIQVLNRVNHEFKDLLPTVDYPVVMFLIKQLFGEQMLKDNGIIESKLYINEVDATDVNLSSFKIKSELNDRLWINNKLNSKVREKLLDIADDFIDELTISNFKPKDIVFTGSLANYNWSRFSDIDIHIIVSFKEVYKKTELIDDYFKSKKEIWNQTHENLKIYGYPVEISVENEDEPGVSSGVYSLIKNKWVVEPSDFDNSRLNETYIKEFSAKIMTEIDEIEKKIKSEKRNDKLEALSNKVMKIFKRLKNMRKEGLERTGEMSSGNVIYKVLRRTNYLDKIWEIINTTYNKINSIK